MLGRPFLASLLQRVMHITRVMRFSRAEACVDALVACAAHAKCVATVCLPDLWVSTYFLGHNARPDNDINTQKQKQNLILYPVVSPVYLHPIWRQLKAVQHSHYNIHHEHNTSTSALAQQQRKSQAPLRHLVVGA